MRTKLILLVIMGLYLVPITKAQLYNDEELSSGNIFAASTLDIFLDREDLNIGGEPIDKEGKLPGWYPGTSGENTFYVENKGNLPFVYGLRIELVRSMEEDDRKLCEAMDLEVNYIDGGGDKLVYEGKLTDLFAEYDESDSKFDHMYLLNDPTLEHAYNFKVTLPVDEIEADLADNLCRFGVVSYSWQKDLMPETGFWDDEMIVQKIQSANWDHVILNEIMWAGSELSGEDEWIELYNDTDEDINISGFKIKNGAGDDDETTDDEDESELILPVGSIIKANGYFLISNFDSDDANSALADGVDVDWVTTKIDLADEGEDLLFTDPADNTLDGIKTQKDGGGWESGDNGVNKMSMERNDLVESGWHKCTLDIVGTDFECNNDEFWDIDNGSNYGTPKAENLSEDDPSELILAVQCVDTELLQCIEEIKSENLQIVDEIPFIGPQLVEDGPPIEPEEGILNEEEPVVITPTEEPTPPPEPELETVDTIAPEEQAPEVVEEITNE